MKPFSSMVALGVGLVWWGAIGGPCGRPAAAAEVARIADATERIRHLRAELSRHDELYYRQARPEISDVDYDSLKRELAELERRYPAEAASLGASPVHELGDDRSPGWAKHRHGERMLGLEKTTTEAGLRDFDARLRAALGEAAAEIGYVIEPKFDGLAVSVTYEDGRLARIATRGDGEEGDDVTARARIIRSLPAQLAVRTGEAPPRRIELRGEVYLSFAEFDRINGEREEAGEPPFGSPRNLAAGTLKSADPTDRQLEVVFYGVGRREPAGGAASQWELLAELGAWGLPVVANAVQARTIAEAARAVHAFERARSDLPYPIDGAVVKLDAFALRARVGETATAPRWAIAFKYAPQRVTTRLKGVTLQVGRTGLITPVAELEPVQLGGATISRATLHNADEIARRDLRVGDFVFLERRGEIIPAIAGVDLTRRDPALVPFAFPTTCPGCGVALTRGTGAAAWRCDNAECPARLERVVLHFASSDGVGIKGLGEATVGELVHRRAIRQVSDLYRLDREVLVQQAGLSVRAADALLAEIVASKRAPLWRFVVGLGVPGVGRTGAKALARKFEKLEALAGAEEKQLRAVPGIGAQTANVIVEFFADPGTRRELAALRSLGVEPSGQGAAAGAASGRVFVLSGDLPTLSHAQAAELIEAAGGSVASTVTRRTDYLVAGAAAGGKEERARALGVPVLDETQLRAVLAGPAAARSPAR